MKSLYTLLIALFISGTTFAQWICGDTLVDPRDGKRYPTVQIGSDCWMAQNLNYGQYVASTTSSVQHSDMSNDGNVQKYCQNNDSMNCITYGGLYDWNEMMNYSTTSGSQGICPPGWHVATDPEYTAMVLASGASLSGTAGNGGNVLKAIGQGVGGGQGTNTSGFSALAGGDRDGLGVFYGTTQRFIFWSSTISPATTEPWQYTLWNTNDTIQRLDDAGHQSGFSCRCVRDLGAGIGENENGLNFQLFPNPTQDRVTIYLPDNTSSGIYFITNTVGQEVESGAISGTNTVIEIRDLSEGIYFLNVMINGKYAAQKLTVE